MLAEEDTGHNQRTGLDGDATANDADYNHSNHEAERTCDEEGTVHNRGDEDRAGEADAFQRAWVEAFQHACASHDQGAYERKDQGHVGAF